VKQTTSPRGTPTLGVLKNLCFSFSKISSQVLLLEAGGEESPLSDIPCTYPALQTSPLDWQYKTEPNDRACLGLNGRRSNWPRGKVIGGSSVLNAMLYVRGNRRDYDAWEAAGNEGESGEGGPGNNTESIIFYRL
jgi:Choline dehydrogenase and related flavoproteins